MSWYYYCPRCGGVYLGRALNLQSGTESWEALCPNALCGGYAFEIDEEMIIPIKILHKKGYKTSYCCSGHVYTHTSGGYIMFDTRVIEMPETSPDGWFIDGNVIRYRYRSKDDNDSAIKKRSYQHVQINRLIRWCEDLPPAVHKGKVKSTTK
jgi:hypothetical protein